MNILQKIFHRPSVWSTAVGTVFDTGIIITLRRFYGNKYKLKNMIVSTALIQYIRK